MINDYFHITVRKSLGLLIPIESALSVVTCLRQEICPIPGVASPVKGVFNQQGELFWVLSFGDLLGLPQGSENNTHQKLTVVILTSPTESDIRFGGVVNTLEGLVSLSKDSITPVPTKFRSQARSMLAGVASIENQKAAILNVPKVFQHCQSAFRPHSLVS